MRELITKMPYLDANNFDVYRYFDLVYFLDRLKVITIADRFDAVYIFKRGSK